MIEFYPEIKLVHIVAVVTSGALFLVRGLAVQMHGQWAMAAPLRYLSYSIDSVLLTAAFMLLTILPAGVYGNGWLAVKVSLLLVYILLGTFALKRGRTQRVRLTCFVAAVSVYSAMFMIARTHQPLGPLLYIKSWVS